MRNAVSVPEGAVEITRSIYRVNGKLFHVLGGVLPDGPWHSEPDRVEFESNGFSCLLVRNAAWCGYVAMPPGHPWHKQGMDEVRGVDDNNEDDYPDVHGGLTYSAECAGKICHVAKPGEPDDVWWLGFDCNHSGDLSLWDLQDNPSGVRSGSAWNDRYRTVEYARAETVKLAAQAKRVALVDSMRRSG